MRNRGEDVKLASQGFDDSPGPLAPIAGSGFQIRSNEWHAASAQPWMAADGTRLVGLRMGLSALARTIASLLHTPAHPDTPKTPAVAALCLARQQDALRPTRRDMPIIGAEHHLAPVLTLALVSRIFDVAFARLPSPAYPRGPVGRLRSHALLKTPKTRFCQSRRVQPTSFAPFASAFPVTVRIGSVHHGYDRLV
jgi:hypothetical protein